MSDHDQDPELRKPFDLEQAPLDRSPVYAIDWGGDGSDLTRPVRAHVLAALRPAGGPYQPPLDALLSLGKVDPVMLAERSDDLDIGQAHLSELLRMLRDRALNTAYDNTLQSYAPVHALEIISELDLSAVVDELIPLLDLDFYQIGEQLPDLLGQVGAPASAPLQAYLADRTRWVWGRARAADALEELAEYEPELRAEVVASLSAILAAAATDHEDVVTSAMGALVDLGAVETLPLIRQAFELGKIDETLLGPWGEVLEVLGVEPAADDPLLEASLRRFEERRSQMIEPELLDSYRTAHASPRAEQRVAPQRAPAQQPKSKQAGKAKNKRKTAAASRKLNRKKRK